MSSVTTDSLPSHSAASFRLKRAEDFPPVPCAVPFSNHRATQPATDHGSLPIVEQPIIILVNTAPNTDAALTAAMERGSVSMPAIGWSRTIPEAALPAVREIYTLLRNQCGFGGSFTALAVEKRHAEDSRDARGLTSLEFRELSIDPARREVWVEGSLIGLTKSEFDLLYVLAQRPGVVFSRRQIVLAYKGADYPVDDRSIDVQMFNLRRKIRSAGSVLQTIRGVGYRFAGQSA
ncbi:MAG: winged helix-turn-helix domain-containing protein [Planctomycetia bacterium]|nr:winged helix-turn-helix domain-containing protein [Planctomycetia bacterium]